MSTALSCTHLDAGYAGVAVARDVTINVEPGEVVGLIGPNGAGKTAILMTLAGLLPPLGGEIAIAGETLHRTHGAKMSRHGLAFVPHDRALFTTLSTRENLRLAQRKGGPTEGDILEVFPVLSNRLAIAAGALSGGEQQMLAIGRAILQKPKALVVDEMSMGLAPAVAKSLIETLRTIAKDSLTGVIVVEQHIGLALAHADRAIVLVKGQVVLTGNAADLAKDPNRLRAAYMGRGHDTEFIAVDHSDNEPKSPSLQGGRG